MSKKQQLIKKLQDALDIVNELMPDEDPPKKKSHPIDDFDLEKMKLWGGKEGYSQKEIEKHFAYFEDYIRNKRGPKYKDLEAAFRNCVRSNWGHIRKNGRDHLKEKYGDMMQDILRDAI